MARTTLTDGTESRHEQLSKWKHRLCVTVTIICCWLLHCTCGFSYSFGNINPYLTSYLRNLSDTHSVDYTDTLWIIQSSGMVQCLLMPFVGLLSTRLRTKLYLFTGLLFFAGSLFGTYWSVQASFPLTIVTYGIIGGVAQAILYPAPLNVVAKWMPSKVGFVSGMVLTGYGLGAFMWNFLITWYINPHNLQPDIQVGEDVFYSQPEVLSKVPSCFLVLGGVFAGIQLLAVILICEAPSTPPHVALLNNATSDTATAHLLGSDCEEEEELSPVGQNSTSIADCDSLPRRNGHIQDDDDLSPQHQYHPKELLKSRVAWTLWWIMLAIEIGTAFVINLFKAYGQTFIHDDHFLSLVASFSSICNAAGRPFWGILADKIGPRMVSLVCQGILVFLVATYVTCEVTGRVMYFLWTCGMFLSMCGLFTMVPSLVYRLFGEKYFNANLGLVDSEGVIGAMSAALLAPLLKAILGWHGVFYFSYGMLFIGLLLNMSLDIQCGRTIPKQMHRVLSLHY